MIFLLFLLGITLGRAGIARAADVLTLNPVETLTVVPKGFKQEVAFNVTLPPSYGKEPNKKYFVIFDLHPRSQPFISGMHDWLSHNGEWPWLETIVVTQAKYNPLLATLFKQLVADPSDQRLLDLIEFDVLRAIDKKYRSNGFRIYSGFMGNGALGLYTLLNRPELFNAYIIASPTLDNDFGAIMSQAANKLKRNDRRQRFLYLSIGEHRYEQAHVEAFKEFEQTLRKVAPSWLDWHSDHANQHYYMSRPIIALLNGIETLFNDIHQQLAADSAISKQGAEAVVAHYAMLSTRKYGFDISAEDSLKNLAQSLLEREPKRAMSIYQQTVALYPKSAYALSALAKAYAQLGDISRAIDYQSQAVEQSKSMMMWHQNQHKKYLAQYEAQLSAQ